MRELDVSARAADVSSHTSEHARSVNMQFYCNALLNKSLDIKIHLVAGWDPTVSDAQGYTGLHISAGLGHIECVREFILHGPKGLIEQRAKNGVNCLHIACKHGHIQILRELVRAAGKSILLSTCELGRTCLFMASVEGHAEMVKYLIKAGGPSALNIAAQGNITCLFAAAMCGHFDVVKMLVAAGGRELLLRANEHGLTCLHAACERGFRRSRSQTRSSPPHPIPHPIIPAEFITPIPPATPGPDSRGDMTHTLLRSRE
jgi:ankyrin repeat protein